MRRAIIHVGTPRSGTSTFQRLLHDHRAPLLQAGVLYPELRLASGETPHLNHQHLGEALDGRRPASDGRELLGQLEAQLRSTEADVAIVSYERLCLASPRLDLPRVFKELLARAGFEMEVVVTLRQPAWVLNSQYGWRMQHMREGRPFALFAHAWLGSRVLDLVRLLTPWWRVAAEFHAVPLHDACSGHPFVQRIFEQTGLLPRLASPGLAGLLESMVDTNRLRAENRSPGPVAVEVARRLHRGGAHRGLGANARAATTFVEERAAARGLDPTAFCGLGPDMLAKVQASRGQADDRFAQMAWGQPWSARVANEAGRPVNEIARLPRDEDIERQIEELLQATCEWFRISRPLVPRVSGRDLPILAGAERIARDWSGRALSWM